MMTDKNGGEYRQNLHANRSFEVSHYPSHVDLTNMLSKRGELEWGWGEEQNRHQ